MIIAIDGPAASGKSTTARAVAKRLSIMYLNTGSMYRALTLGIMKSNIDLNDKNAIQKFLDGTTIGFDKNNQILLNGRNVSTEIQAGSISDKVSAISANSVIRKTMVKLQREIAGENDCVLEGRDIGTVVFPNAEFKFFLLADISVRATRRMKDLQKLGESRSLNRLKKEILKRDEFDSTREYSPLLKADDAISIDTTEITINQTIEKIINYITKVKNEEAS
ncbi:MAG: cytidylate kinase [Candidatus Marinimicrobia bacterium]|nr:cytidylate kinase [Candidatus Neomarinimicrobiota bacterium]|tara:strand:- start:123 stop:788 length:666 start_codon:yes stop_codon:yes gene_type:complete